MYILDRPPGQVPILSDLSLYDHTEAVFGSIGHSLPTFAHVLAFCLLTAALLRHAKRHATVICLGWFCIDVAFELGQTQQVAGWLLQFIPHWFENLPILEQTDGYFAHGTFDVGDLVSIALGAVTAYCVIRRTPPQEKCHA